MNVAREAIQESGLSKPQIARDTGLSRATLEAWIVGTRAPEPDSLLRLAAGLEHRSDRIRELAARVRATARKEAGE